MAEGTADAAKQRSEGREWDGDGVGVSAIAQMDGGEGEEEEGHGEGGGWGGVRARGGVRVGREKASVESGDGQVQTLTQAHTKTRMDVDMQPHNETADSAKEHYVSATEPCGSAVEPHSSAKEPQNTTADIVLHNILQCQKEIAAQEMQHTHSISAKEPYICAKEPYISAQESALQHALALSSHNCQKNTGVGIRDVGAHEGGLKKGMSDVEGEKDGVALGLGGKGDVGMSDVVGKKEGSLEAEGGQHHGGNSSGDDQDVDGDIDGDAGLCP